MSVHEECGVFGIMAGSAANVAETAYYGLFALQHRGQESCGIVVNDDGVFTSHKDIGLVSEVFTKETLSAFPKGTMAVAHTRYATTGKASRNNCQPIEVNHQKGKMALAHNGNLSNAAKLRSKLELSGAIFHTSSDTEIIAYLVTKERLKTASIEDALCSAVKYLEGAYSLILMSAQKLICARDPHGFRPLSYGKTKDGSYIVASESCALSAVGAEFIRDVEPGEVLIFSPNGIESRKDRCKTTPIKHCIFEYIYFSRPDSVLDGISVQAARIRSGEVLAKRYATDADVVIGVPDSGLDAALGYSIASGIPYRIGLIKNKYIGRTFISPENRSDQVRIKLAPVPEAVEGKKIVLVDDSIVRGTTS
ncbi:MAG: amidophosphoribosyltransferase, partial [Clostridia bacterium]|nr:amidophosphoribosyltransferase [Clostridia bacterium]